MCIFMFRLNFKYNLIIYFCILLMMSGCQNTTEKLIVENKISTKLSKKDKLTLRNEKFLKNKIFEKAEILEKSEILEKNEILEKSENLEKNENLEKSEIVISNKENLLNQKDNDVIFEFKNERLLHGRDNFKVIEKEKTKKALSAVYKMLKQNISSNNYSLNLKNSDKIQLENKYFHIKQDGLIYKNILAFLPLTGPYSNYGIKTRKALDLSVLYYGSNEIKILYFDTGKNIEEMDLRKLFDNISPNFIIGPLRREILLRIKPIAKSKSIPILTFSNDTSLRENNIWSLGFSPEEQVESVISCALSHGYENFGLVAPDNLYGRILTKASIDLISVSRKNKYDTILLSNDQINYKPKLFSILKRFLKYNENQAEHRRFDSILIGGSREFILEIAPLLAFFNVDSRHVKILGTEKFNLKEIRNEPSLEKAWFPVILSKNDKGFKLFWQETWGEDINYFSNAGFDSGVIGINYTNIKKDSTRTIKNILGPITGSTFQNGGYVKKPIHVMQIENLGKLTNIKKCNNFKN